MSDARIGIVHPGAMGAEVGAALGESGRPVHWASTGRSDATVDRARRARMIDTGDLSGLTGDVQVLLSICPPHAARAVAAEIASTGYSGIYVDANAVAPATVAEIADVVEPAGATLVDGSILGPPPTSQGMTRLYLSGPHARAVAHTLGTSRLGVVTLDDRIGSASAIKVAHATWRKATSALLTTLLSYARHHGVTDALLAEWAQSLPELVERSASQPRHDAVHAWRFAGELEEMAAALGAVGLPDGAAAAAARIYTALAGFKDAAAPPALEAVLDALDSAASHRA